MIVFVVVGGVLLVEVIVLGCLVAAYVFEKWRERRECEALTREFEEMVGSR